MTDDLKLYNSLTKQKEVFTPIDKKHIKVYVCGPTVYDFAHIGNARPVVVFDILYRLLKHLYPKVTYVRNITDVDDKINAASKTSKESIKEITLRTTKAYHDDMSALNALSPDIEPRATDHITHMIDMIQNLIDKDYVYEANQHVLFRHQKFNNYGQLSRRSLDEMVAGARVEIAPYKENPGDFVLWKPSSDDDPGWQSPWGRGRPGWHIECSAMSATYLGKTFDIHGGGIDLIFPHHENEIAQSCAAHGTTHMANYWVHNGHLMVNGKKMSKSLGNFFTVHELLEKYDGEVIRLALLQTHYRQPFDWNDETLPRSKQILDRFYRALCDEEITNDESLDVEFLNHLFDDLNTPQALSYLHEKACDYYRTKDRNYLKSLKTAGNFLGLLLRDPKDWLKGVTTNTDLNDCRIEELCKKRLEARAQKDFATADAIRKDLESQGIILEDTKDGTKWRRE
jgi:cysteinyl-tRNA synthetase